MVGLAHFSKGARQGLGAAALLALAACSVQDRIEEKLSLKETPEATPPAEPAPKAEPAVLTVGPGSTTAPTTLRIYASARHLECVPYARSVSSVALRGDAWTWWRSAEQGYRRDNKPAVGSVLVLKRTDHLDRGHVSVVSRVVNSREILVYHANWLNRGQIFEDLPVRDVSPANDWSMVRVWYPPSHSLGKRAYPAYGFVHPEKPRTLSLNQPLVRGPDVRLVQEALVEAGFPVAPDGIFGPATNRAVRAYQNQLGLAADGVVGPATRARLGI